MIHAFDTEIAKKYGVTEAILLHRMVFYLEKNIVNDKHFYDGNYWIYNSVKAWKGLFDYLTERQLRTVLEKLKEMGAIATANYNKMKYDRTTWYAIIDFDIFNIYGINIKEAIQNHIKENNSDIYISEENENSYSKMSKAFDENVKWKKQNSQIEITEKSNRNDQSVKPIPEESRVYKEKSRGEMDEANASSSPQNLKNDNSEEEREAPSCKLQFDDFVGLILKACEELTAQTCVAIESVKSFRCHGRIEKLKELYDNPKSEALDCLNKAKAIAAKDKPSFRLESFASNLLVLLQNGIDDIEDITVDIENNEFESSAKVDDIEYTQATSYDADKFIKAVKYWLAKITNSTCKTYKSYELEELRTAFEHRKNHAGHVLIYSADWALDNKQYAYFNFYKKLLELLTLDFDNWKNHRLYDIISSVRMEGKSKKRIKTLNLRRGAIKPMVEAEKPARNEPQANERASNQVIESENRADITPEEQATINDIKEQLKLNMKKAFAF